MRYKVVFVLLLSITTLRAQEVFDSNKAFVSTFSKLNDTILFSQNSEIPVVPASLLKILTTSTALEVLGPDYRFKTRVGYKGEIQNGILNGDVIIVAGSDPTLGSQFFDSTDVNFIFKQVVESLNEKQIKSINGHIQVQHNGNSINYPSSRLWEDMANYYGAIPHKLNYRDNTIKVTLQSKELGSYTNVVKVDPNVEYYNFESRVFAADHNKDSAYVYGIGEMQKWWIEGSIPANRDSFTIKAAMPDPSMVFVDELQNYLEYNDIDFRSSDNDFSDSSGSFELLCEIYSPPLSEIIKVTNHKSINLFADQLFLLLAEEYSGVQSWDMGILAIAHFWQDKIDYTNNFAIVDGSGLSPKNLATSNGLVQLLTWMKEESEYFDVFLESLPISGYSGTIKYSFTNAKLKGKVYAKSGSMKSVMSYAGYYLNSNNNYVPFCVVTNNFLTTHKSARHFINQYLTKQLSN